MSFAALPMYDRPARAAAHDAVWDRVRDAMRARGIAAPDALDRTLDPHAGWRRPDLVLGQVCSLPLRLGAAEGAARVGVLDYGLPGLDPGAYRSVFVVRREAPSDDPMAFLDGPIAVNSADSQSGRAAPHFYAAARNGQWARAVETGAHLASAQAVADGRAEIAALDAVTWIYLLAESHPVCDAVRVIGETEPGPGMTLVTRADAGAVREALQEGLEAVDPAVRADLHIAGLVDLPPSAYDLPRPPPPPFSVA